MAITILPIDADPATLLPKYTAQQYRQARAAEHGGGSGRQLGLRSGFRVGTPSNVLTATSTTWTLGPCAAKLDVGDTVQGGYDWANDSNFTGSGAQGVQAADSTYARKDIVYIQVNDTNSDGSGLRSAPLVYLAGTASATPVAPTLPARSFLVGTISVPISGGGSPTVVLNPARYVAAGGILPVADEAARLALTAYEGLVVDQQDTDRLYRHNGARWAQVSAAELGRSTTGVGGTLAATPSWSDILIVAGTSLGGEVMIDYNVTLANANSGAHRDAAVRVTCDGAEIDGWAFVAPHVAGIESPVFPSLQVFHTPTAGAHTWKIQGNASIAGAVKVLKGSVTVTEKP